ncbi:MAG: cation transporter [Ruminococcaceae bacterium]|nr:cation transporter [Oscillospiraceae bacterium]
MTNIILKRYKKDGIISPEGKAAIGKISGFVGILANIILAVAKFIIGTLTASMSITADALNNLTDAASSVITLIGFKLSEQPADKEHPYGHARFEYLSALAVSVLIIFIGYELGKSSVIKILNPADTSLTLISVIVLLLSIITKLWLSFFNKKLGRAINSPALIATSTDSRNDVIATAAVLIAAVIEYFTKFRTDGFMGLAVAIFILYSGVTLARETVSPLLGENASPELKENIVDYISSCPKVLGYHDLMVHDYGMGRRFASLHVEMDRSEDPFVCHELIDDMERECKRSHGVELVIHYDPVITGDAVLDSLKAEVCGILTAIDSRITIHDFRAVLGDSHTNIIFDAVLPSDIKVTPAEITEEIENSLSKHCNKKYYAVITFDSADFN